MRVCRTDELTVFLCILINHVRTYPHVSFVRTCTDYYFVFLISMSKRSADNDNLPQIKRKMIGFNPEWGRDFPFVPYCASFSKNPECTKIALIGGLTCMYWC